jgi:hypothetical protein
MPGRSLLIKASGARLLYPGYVQDYLDRVTAADVAAGNTLGLERGVTDAFNTCLQALVADGILGVSGGVLTQAASLIKASCAMQGARTLPGSLVPLADDMPKPTNFNFVAGDYNRRTGLGDPANVSKYLNTNKVDNTNTPSNRHAAVFESTPATLATNVISLGVNPPTGAGDTLLVNNATPLVASRLGSEATDTIASAQYSGFFGASRSLSASYTVRINGTSTAVTQASSASVSALTIFVFAQNNNGSPTSLSNARLNYYSLGSALDLVILDARITALATAIQAAIAP